MTDTTVPAFADLALAPAVLATLNDIGYEQPSPIQAQSIPHLLNGEDLLGMAQTGTGKTAAFALPTLTRINTSLKSPQVLVLTPTRELAIQVAEAFQTYAGKMSGFHVLPIYGGQDMRTQLRALDRGVQVVVGTPGRVMDHLRRGSLKLEALQTVVLDEADEMLRMGFIDDVTWILDHTPDDRQVALFSATMPEEIRRVTENYLNDPKVVKIQAETATVDRIEQSYWLVKGTHKLDALTRILEVEDFDGLIIFVRTKTATVELAEKLSARGYASAAINGDMNQTLRERTIDNLKQGKLDILIATDVAARGIDVPRISHVINYDIPYDNEAYVHRIGRTGRAGRSGKAILFVAPREKRLLYSIEKTTRQKIPALTLPSHAEVADKRIEQFKQQVLSSREHEDIGFFRDLIQSWSNSEEVDVEEIAAALCYLAQKERPLKPPKEKKVHQERERPQRDGDRRQRDNERRERKPRDRKPGNYDDGVVRNTYRVEVGRNHGVKPGDLVGAIANEAEIDSQFIGHIKLHDEYSTVDLPDGMPKAVAKHLRKVWVRGRQLQLSQVGEGAGSEDRPLPAKKPRKPKKHRKGNSQS